MDSGVLTYCPEKKEHDLPLFGVLSPVCSIDVRELAAEEDELKVEFEKSKDTKNHDSDSVMI